MDLCVILIDIHNNDKKQVLDPFENPNVYTFTKQGRFMKVSNFDEYDEVIVWEHNFDYFEFIKAFTKELKQYLKGILEKDISAKNHSSFTFLEESLVKLNEIVAKEY